MQRKTVAFNPYKNYAVVNTTLHGVLWWTLKASKASYYLHVIPSSLPPVKHAQDTAHGNHKLERARWVT